MAFTTLTQQRADAFFVASDAHFTRFASGTAAPTRPGRHLDTSSRTSARLPSITRLLEAFPTLCKSYNLALPLRLPRELPAGRARVSSAYWQCRARRWARVVVLSNHRRRSHRSTPFGKLLALTPQPSGAQRRLDTSGMNIQGG